MAQDKKDTPVTELKPKRQDDNPKWNDSVVPYQVATEKQRAPLKKKFGAAAVKALRKLTLGEIAKKLGAK